MQKKATQNLKQNKKLRGNFFTCASLCFAEKAYVMINNRRHTAKCLGKTGLGFAGQKKENHKHTHLEHRGVY